MINRNHVFEDEDGAPYPEEVQKAAHKAFARMPGCGSMDCRVCEENLNAVMNLCVTVDKAVGRVALDFDELIQIKGSLDCTTPLYSKIVEALK